MRRRSPSRHHRLLALFLLGVVAFSPPLLRIFGREADLFGWPLLYLYIFGAWGGLILLIALQTERRSHRAGQDPTGSAQGDR